MACGRASDPFPFTHTESGPSLDPEEDLGPCKQTGIEPWENLGGKGSLERHEDCHQAFQNQSYELLMSLLSSGY